MTRSRLVAFVSTAFLAACAFIFSLVGLSSTHAEANSDSSSGSSTDWVTETVPIIAVGNDIVPPTRVEPAVRRVVYVSVPDSTLGFPQDIQVRVERPGQSSQTYLLEVAEDYNFDEIVEDPFAFNLRLQ